MGDEKIQATVFLDSWNKIVNWINISVPRKRSSEKNHLVGWPFYSLSYHLKKDSCMNLRTIWAGVIRAKIAAATLDQITAFRCCRGCSRIAAKEEPVCRKCRSYGHWELSYCRWRGRQARWSREVQIPSGVKEFYPVGPHGEQTRAGEIARVVCRLRQY